MKDNHEDTAELVKLVENLIGRATSSVSGETDYVVAGKDTGSKLDKAKENDVEILNVDKFKKLIDSKK